MAPSAKIFTVIYMTVIMLSRHVCLGILSLHNVMHCPVFILFLIRVLYKVSLHSVFIAELTDGAFAHLSGYSDYLIINLKTMSI